MGAVIDRLLRATRRGIRRILPADPKPGSDPAYAERTKREIEHFKEVEVVHDLPDIFHYWSNRYLRPILEEFGFSNPNEFFLHYLKTVCRASPGRRCCVVSLGAGNAETELMLARDLLASQIDNFTMECLDLNPHMLERGAAAVGKEGLSDFFVFTEWDLNQGIPPKEYDVVIANHALHHFVELERLFDGILRRLRKDGYFVTCDMIGRNGHMRWPEALELVHEFWRELPASYRFNHQLGRTEPLYENWDCSVDGFEGIRAQDILPLLVQRFHFDLFIGYGNVVDVFVERGFGPNFDPEKEWDRNFIDRIQDRNQEALEAGKVTPTQMVAALCTSPRPTKVYKHLTPEFCIRRPKGSPKTDSD